MPRVAPSISLDRIQQTQLQQLVKSPSTPQSLVLRGRIILAAAEQQSNQEIAGMLGIPEITASKWRRRFAGLGWEGLQDAPRAGRPPKHGPEVWEKVQRRACQQPEFQSRWSVRTLARELRLPSTTVHTILANSHLQPHRSRTFTFSPDPDFEAKLLDIVGLYLNPPDHALVLCVDEKTGIQALDRTQPLLPLRAKKPRSWTNEYVRHGTQTLLAALKIATGEVLAHVLLGRAQILQAHKSSDPGVAKAAAVIEDASLRIAELIRELGQVVKEGHQDAVDELLDMRAATPATGKRQ